jgi:DNA invertase Pin-like site-specific DNA recombinase
MRVAIYVRCSTKDQNVEAQLRDLRQWAQDARYDVIDEYVDEGVSAVKKRPALNRLMRDAARRKFDCVACWTMDRLGRSMPDFVKRMSELAEYDVHIFSYKHGIDTKAMLGRQFAYFCGMLAEMEREFLIERTKAGMETARRKGKRIGRPPASATPEGARCDKLIRDMLRDRKPIRQIKTALGVSQARIERVRNGVAA